MTDHIVFESIPKTKFSMFHEVLVSTNGRYLTNPFFIGDKVYLHYQPGPEHNMAWVRANRKENGRSVPLIIRWYNLFTEFFH